MSHVYWYLVAAALFALIAYLNHVIERLPISTAMIYLVVGFALGPALFGAVRLDPLEQRGMLETLAEIAVLVSLFTDGVKLRIPLRSPRWRVAVRLATLAMLATIALLVPFLHLALGLGLGAAVLFAAVLAPTDPVLASAVQPRDPADRDRLRFDLTGEGAMNDGTAFPFVFLGLGLLGLRELGDYGALWAMRDLLWGTAGGLLIGFACGHGAAALAKRLRTKRAEAVRLDEFLLLAVIASSYGLALAVEALGFLAVFAAGVALRRFDETDTAQPEPDPPEAITPAVLQINEQLERIAAVALVLLVGAMISGGYWSWHGLIVAAVLFFVARPVAVALGLIGIARENARRGLIAWFGIRGIGSLYYVAYAAGQGLEPTLARTGFEIVFSVIAASVLAHGISATPLMDLYERRRSRRSSREVAATAWPREPPASRR